ncbi:hypothetical protein GCM10018793_32080 [Streptomyces sulfonofaciens]|uniref:Uncharacterized protein n=1 Tax=Streptomyces sulfonofaciens TaxID=68272 RepID=A0A919G8J4_9ACTN|nr:hypothetical protein [Streptomyces sulfonofaciens]GHH79396.1 hypothetical protein GCM10018793_32080 [Streptomyces sulfonofaciens]
MAQAPNAAQRRIIAAADPVTGRLGGPAGQLAALVRLGLAFRHPRPPHDTFLTPAGHRAREAARAAAADAPSSGPPAPAGPVPGPDARAAGRSPGSGPAGQGPVPAPDTDGREPGGSPAGSGAGGQEPADRVFAARTGDEPERYDGPGRARQVRSAWQGLVELRRMTHPDAATDRPCPWERTHLVQAAALALEAAGCPPGTAGSGGYRVAATAQPEAVAVHAPTTRELRVCAAALERAGWQPSEHTDRRTGARYLLASPRRA